METTEELKQALIQERYMTDVLYDQWRLFVRDGDRIADAVEMAYQNTVAKRIPL